VDRKRAENLGRRERQLGIDTDDEAGRWLAAHDPKQSPPPREAKFKSKALHRWRRRQQRGG